MTKSAIVEGVTWPAAVNAFVRETRAPIARRESVASDDELRAFAHDAAAILCAEYVGEDRARMIDGAVLDFAGIPGGALVTRGDAVLLLPLASLVGDAAGT
jgi:hypothetical protein